MLSTRRGWHKQCGTGYREENFQNGRVKVANVDAISHHRTGPLCTLETRDAAEMPALKCAPHSRPGCPIGKIEVKDAACWLLQWWAHPHDGYGRQLEMFARASL